MTAIDSFSFLRKIPLFAELPDPYLEVICQQSETIHLSEGDLLFSEGDFGTHAYVIMEGQVEIFKVSNQRPVSLAVRQAGDVIGEIALLESAPRNASGRALTECRLLAIGSESFNHLLDIHPSAVRILLHTVTHRLQSTELLLRQSEKMAQLGVLTAGIAHELNNPSAAVQRGTERIRAGLADLRQASLEISAVGLNQVEITTLRSLEEELQKRTLAAADMDAIERSDREEAIESWLDEEGVEDGWVFAGSLVEMGFTSDALSSLRDHFPRQHIRVILRWAISNFNIARLLDEVNMGSERMSEIVKALKTYVYLDQGPIQKVDIHEGLENTLVILRFKLKQGISIRREYDPALPGVEAYGSELNQVWTNIIDNAIDAMDGSGEITLRTSYHDPWVVVGISDNGPGIPEHVLPNIFSPFFTTKAVGKGTGLGLNTSYNIVRKHNGDIKVFSRPGETRFEVWLPRTAQTPGNKAPSPQAGK